MPLPPKTPNPPQLPAAVLRDPADMLREVLVMLVRDSARALAAARAGQCDQALRAALDMQRVLNGQQEVLRQVSHAGRSKRVPLDMRQRVRASLRDGLAPVAETVRLLGIRLKAARARQEALSAALAANATRPASVYAARGYSKQGRAGAVRPVETIRHAVAIMV